MRQLAGWAWFFMLFSVTVWPQLPTLNVEQYPASVRAQIAQAYREAQAHPGKAEAVGKLGMVLHSYNESQSAADCFARAHSLAPQELRWTYYAGLAQTALGNSALALTLLRQVIDYLPAQVKVADLLFAQNNLDEAEALYQTATKKNPALPWAWYGLGRTQAARQDFTAAIPSFERALALSPRFGAAHYALALALRDAGRVGKAKEHLALYQEYKLIRPVANDPLLEEITALNRSAQGYLNRGLALEAEGDLQGAVTEHEKALTVDPTLVTVQINLIQLYGRLAQPEQAEKHYRSVLRVNPHLAEAHYNYGVVLLSAKKITEARAAFTHALAGNSQYAEAHYNLGVLAMQEQKLEAAVTNFRAAVTANPNFRPAHFEWGRILVAQNQLDEAIRHFELTITPEDSSDAATPRYLYALGAAYIRAGQQAKGLIHLRNARTQAQARGQQELLGSLERDLQRLEGK